MSENKTSRIQAYKTKKGWGSFPGQTTVVSFAEYRGRIEGTVTQGLGLISEAGKFSPPDLLDQIARLKTNGAKVSNETAALLAFARIPSQLHDLYI